MQGRDVCLCASVGSVLVYWGDVDGLASGDHARAILSGPAVMHSVHPRRCHCASWMLLISFLLDMAVGAITRHISLCPKSGESRPQTPDPKPQEPPSQVTPPHQHPAGLHQSPVLFTTPPRMTEAAPEPSGSPTI